ncbi:hypothetical protein DFJ77DRAFT_51572 [Powellomyces hirtus]|nr:hypothetical protein DFJ77DRAFT_51572 [Powellomyces hirtus]
MEQTPSFCHNIPCIYVGRIMTLSGLCLLAGEGSLDLVPRHGSVVHVVLVRSIERGHDAVNSSNGGTDDLLLGRVNSVHCAVFGAGGSVDRPFQSPGDGSGKDVLGRLDGSSGGRGDGLVCLFRATDNADGKNLLGSVVGGSGSVVDYGFGGVHSLVGNGSRSSVGISGDGRDGSGTSANNGCGGLDVETNGLGGTTNGERRGGSGSRQTGVDGGAGSSNGSSYGLGGASLSGRGGRGSCRTSLSNDRLSFLLSLGCDTLGKFGSGSYLRGNGILRRFSKVTDVSTGAVDLLLHGASGLLSGLFGLLDGVAVQLGVDGLRVGSHCVILEKTGKQKMQRTKKNTGSMRHTFM